MAKPDIRILVGNKGDAAANGASAVLIRTNLEKALSSGIKIKVSLDSASTKTLKTQINQLSQQKHTQETDSATNAQKRNADATRKATEEQLRRNKALADGSLALSRFNSYLQTVNPKGLTQFSTQIASIRGMLSSSDPLKMKAAAAATNELKAAMKSAGYEGGNVFTYLGSKIKTFATYLASSVLTMGVINGVRSIISTVKELDGALTDLRIVTGGTKAETQELLAVYNQMAQELGSTTQSVASAAVNWQRQGYSLADTNKLLKDSMVLSIVGAMDSAEATTALTAALKGYKLEVDDASSVVDKFFAVDMNAATSSSKMAIALSKTAANAKLAGLSLDDVIGQLAQVNSVMQEGGEQTGTFYNTMLSRMANIKAGRLEDPEDGESLSDVETTLNGLGIKLRDTNSEFRNFGDVLEDVGEKWESFSSVQKRAVATAFSGTRQQTRFLALMDNWDKAQEYSEVAANSAGVSLDKFGAYEESVEAKTNRMTAAFENFSTTLLDSGFIGFFLDLGTALFNAGAAFDAWPIKLALLTTAVVGAVTAFKALQASFIGTALKNTISAIASIIPTLNATGVAMQSLAAIQGGAALSATQLSAAISLLTPAQIAQSLAVEKLTEDQLLEMLISSKLTVKQQEEILNHYLSVTAKTADSAATVTLTTATGGLTKAIGAFLLTNPVGWCILAAGAIAAVVGIVDLATTSYKENAEALDELRGQLSTIQGDLTSLESELSSVTSRLDELYGIQKDRTLTFVEQEEFERLKSTNDELERQIALAKIEKDNASRDVDKQFAKTYASFVANNGGSMSLRAPVDDDLFALTSSDQNTINAYLEAKYQEAKDLVDYYSEAILDLRNRSSAATSQYDRDYYDDLADNLEGKLSKAQKTMDWARGELDKVFSQYLTWSSQQDYRSNPTEQWEPDYNAALDEINAYLDRYRIIIEGDGAKTTAFNRIINKEEFSSLKKELEELGAAGAVTAEKLADGRYIDLVSQMDNVGISAADLVGYFNAMAPSVDNASDGILDLTDAIEQFGAASEKVQKLQKLMDTLKENGSGSLTAEFLTDLFELLPEVAGKVNSVQEAQEALTSAIDETKTAAQNAYGTMLIANQDWLSAAINGSASLQSALTTYYKNDVKNWKSSAETKWKVDSALVGDLSSLWSKYMGMSVEKIESTVALLEDLSISYGLSERDDTTLREMKAYLALLKSLSVEFDSINWSPPSGSKKSVDEYRSSIDALYESTVRLNDLQNEMSTLEAKRDQLDTEDYRKKIAYSQEIIRLRGEENKILHEQNEIRRREIQDGVDRLTGLGFQIDYTPGANDLLIKNLEHINELVAPSGKIEDTNELRKSAEKLAETIMDLNDDAADASLSWHENLVDLKQDIDSLTDAMGDYFSEWEDVKKHQLNLMENQGGQTSEMIAAYYTMMDEAHRVAEEVRGTLRDAGFSEAEIEASSAVRDLESAWWDYYHSIQDLQQDRLDALNEELDLVKQMIKQEKEDEIDALEKQKDAYSDLIELKKRSLELTERGRGHDEQVNALNKELAKLQGRADTLKLAAASGDRQAALELGSVQEQIMAKQKELSDLQRDYSIENQKDALDQEKQDFEDTQDKKIQDIKDFLADNQRLTQAALDRIEQSGAALFDELSVYASKYTNTTSQQLQKMWDDATEAARGYQSFTEALNQTTQEAYRPGTNGGNTGDSSISDAYIISRMQHNGALWHNADQKTRAELEKENTKLARQLGLDPDKDRRNGRWYWPNSEIPVYHTGGIVGSEITPGQKELLLMAQTGEFIATEKQQQNISSLLKQGEENTGVVGMIRGLIANMTACPSAERPKQDVQFNFTVYAEDGNDFIRQIEGRKREIANILLGATV